MGIYTKVQAVQSVLKVKKNRQNDFGNFNYRNLEDILQEYKKIAKTYGLCLWFDTEPVRVGESNYIKAVCYVRDDETGETMTAKAHAKEPPTPKAKMDESQCTGSATSYAKKYAVNNLFLLDDSIDPDSNQNVDDGVPANEATLKTIEGLCEKHNINIQELYKRRKIKGVPTALQAALILNKFKKDFGDE